MTDLASIPRDSRRVPLETRVQFKFDRFSGFLSEYSANISPGGMYIRSQAPQEAGTLLDFEFRLGDGYELIRGKGEVVWSRPYDEGPRRPAGMGIRFLELSEGSLDLIYKIVDQHVLQGGTPFDVSKSPVSPAAHPPIASSSAPGFSPLPGPPPVPDFDFAALPPPPGPALATPPMTPPSPYGEPGDPLDESILTLHGERRPPTLSPPARAASGGAASAGDKQADARTWLPPFEELDASPMVIKSPDEAADEAWAPPKVPPPSFVPTFGAATAAEERSARRVLAPALVVVGVALLGGAYILRDRLPGWLGIGGGEDVEVQGGVRPDLPRPRLSSDAPPAEGAASDVAGAPDGAGGAETEAAASSAPAEGQGTVAGAPTQASPSPAAPQPPPARQLPSAAATPPAATPRPAPAPAPNPAVEAKAFTQLEKITFEKGADGTSVYLWLDGAITPSRYVRSELGGSSPRLLIKLRGVTRAFPGGKVAVGSGEVLQVRTGYHGEGGLNELHVVLDLARATVKVSRIEEQPRRLRIHLQGK